MGRHAIPVRSRPRDRRACRPWATESPDCVQATSSASAASSIAASTATNAARASRTTATGWSARTTARRQMRRAGRWGLLAADRGARTLRVAHPPSRISARGCGSAALRRHHPVLAAQALECRPRQEGRNRRHRRLGPHGHQARPRHGCTWWLSRPRNRSVPMPWHWAHTRSCCRAMRLKWPLTPRAST